MSKTAFPKLLFLIAITLLGTGAVIAQSQIGYGQEKEITNSIGMKLVLIPKGTFQMGSPPSEDGSKANELQHEVTLIRDYYLGAFEVTQAQYEKVMGGNPSYFQGDRVQGDSSNHPVEEVSWEDAVEFCKKLSDLPEEKAAGRVYRLPTEAEWEYACRAGSTTPYCFGDDESKLGQYACYDKNSGGQTHAVGEKKPNAWGLYDLHGNVREWCSDWADEYRKVAASDPAGPKVGSGRVHRGGSWCDVAADCRSADRDGLVPSFRNSIGGFRLALSSPDIPR